MLLYDHLTIATNGVNLHVVQAGPEDGRLIIFLHGFPEFWYGWRQQIRYFAERGLRVWAPDQRGYNTSDKPAGVAAYSRDELAADVIGLIQAAGREKAIIVGHDWGAAVAWWLANKHPQHVEKLIILNVPHHSTFSQVIQTSPEQRRKSWYMGFFQIPWLPEAMLRANNWRAMSEALTKTSRPGTFSADDLAEYRRAWGQGKAMTTMINWYRSVVQKPLENPPSPRITVPTLMIWGARDAFLGRELAQPSIDLCDDGRLVFIEEATHWVQHEEADRVNALMGEFLA